MAARRHPPELELVNLLAGCASRREAFAPAVRALLERSDFDLLTQTLRERRLLPLIGTRAITTGGAVIPDGFRNAVTRALAAARANGLAVEAATRRAVSRLAERSVRALPLKGPLLAADAHDDVGLRETHDVDLLVARADMGAAIAALEETGYRRGADPLRPGGMPDLHFTLEHPALPAIELHWRIHWDERGFSDRLLARAAEGPDGLLRAAPDDLVASLLLYHARDGFHGVRIAADIAAWWDRHGGGPQHGLLERHARDHPELAPHLTAAALAVERLTGTPAVGWLGGAVSGGRRVALAARLADWTQAGDRDQMAANISLVGALLTPAGSWGAFVRRELSLPGASTPGNAAHAAKMCVRLALGLWAIRGGREWAPSPLSARP